MAQNRVATDRIVQDFASKSASLNLDRVGATARLLKQKEGIAMNRLALTVFLRPEKYAVALLVALLVCAGCAATCQGGTDVAQGRQALFRGDYPTALVHFQSAEKAGPNYVYGTELREGV